jgi:GTP-binding protein
MAEQNFIDYVKILFRSGKGGAGSRHMRRESMDPRGGPDGGDGGRGGHIILKGNAQMWTLLQLKYRKHIYAGDGINGSKNQSSGAYGKDIIVEVPLGTVAKDTETGQVILEITQNEEKKILLHGGRGGLGNTHFKNSVNQSPRYAQPGEPSTEAWIVLELKILADVGLVGFPNAGKSTLLASISAAKPEIADYAFTTLVPNLGMISYRDGRSFVMADIPGIIENAHLGKGLGHRFLRHIERNSALLFMIPCDTADIKKEFRILLNELEMYNPELLDKPRLLAITKADLIDAELESLIRKELPEDIPTIFISAVSQRGLTELKDMIWNTLNPEELS